MPVAIGGEISAALPPSAAVDRWWRVVGVVQGLLLGCVLVGSAWFVSLLVLGVASVGTGIPRLFTNVWFLPAALALVAVGLFGGWLAARLGTRAVSEAATRDSEQLIEDVRQRMIDIARGLVIDPAEQELAELQRFRAELNVAEGRR